MTIDPSSLDLGPGEGPGEALLSAVNSQAFYVVGVGASAGGLEALEQMFAAMPEDSGMAFVVIQHLSPDFKSHMDDLLRRRTSIPTQIVTDGMQVKPNQIYLIPPGKELIINGLRLALTDKPGSGSPTLPVDSFLRSLANDLGSKSIGVILSGTGTDGSRGIREIHAAGGLVICQDPETAKFDGMPKSARQTGVVDLELPPSEIASALTHFRQHGDTRLPVRETFSGEQETALSRIFRLLRRDFGLDFASYKPPTVLRRIERRLALLEIVDVDSYADRVEADADEREALYHDLLIGVTQFFRDPEAFERIERLFLPKLVGRDPDEEIRLWLAGCATGEEAYSIAILLHEFLTANKQNLNVKIFATDVHRRSLEVASTGIYPDAALESVSPDRRRRYFTRVEEGWQVTSELRQLLVFAVHNVISDAPFTRLDLVVCRNLLIYLQPLAQKKVLSLFHFGLRTGGILFLGPSETPGELGDEFESLDSQWRVYRKRRDVRLAQIALPPQHDPQKEKNGDAAVTGRFGPKNLLNATYTLLLDRYMPSAILVDDQFQIIHVFGSAGSFLRFRPGRMTGDLMELIIPDLKTPLHGALQQAASKSRPVQYSGTVLREQDGRTHVDVRIEPIHHERINVTQYLVVLEEQDGQDGSEEPVTAVDLTTTSREQIELLEAELKFSQENLQATIEELETTNEELQATNEELLASNEELQSSNEELHSLNEELYTVNSEHQRKIEELTEMTADMDNLLTSTDVGVIYLDQELRVRRFTPRMAQSFHLMPQDVGRRLDSFAHTIDHPGLLEDLQSVLATGEPVERNVTDNERFNYFLRVLPYETPNGREGVVLTLIPIDALKQAELQVRQLSSIVESSEDAIISKDLSGIITSWNRGAERLYGYTAEEVVGKSIEIIIPDDLRREIHDVLQQIRRGQAVEQFETRRRRQDGTEVNISLRISPLRNEHDEIIGASAIGRDITELRRRDEQIRVLIDSTPQALYGLDLDGHCTFANKACVELLGYEHRDELIGQNMHELIHHHRPDGSPYPRSECKVYTAFQSGAGAHVDDEVLFRRDGTSFPAEYWSHPVGPADRPSGAVVTFLDITERLRTEAELARLAGIVEATTDFVGVWDPDGTALFLNRAAHELFGIDDDAELSGYSLDDFHPAWAARLLREEGLPTAAGEGAWFGETALQLPDGTLRPVSQNIVAHRNADGDVTFFSTIIRDLSALKEAQHALRLHQRAIDLAATGIIITDAGQGDNPIIYANEGFLRVTGYSQEETLGRNCRFLQGPETDPVTVQRIREAIARQKESRTTILNYRKDGSTFWNELHISPVRNESGQVTHFVGVQTDVTDRMKTETTLKQQNRVLQTLQTVSTSLAAQLNLESLLQQITDAGRELSGAAFGAFFYNAEGEDGERYMLYTLSGAPQSEFANFPMPRKTEVFGPTFDGTAIVRSDDITKDPRFGKNEPYYGLPRGHLPVRSYLAVPVKARNGEVIGGLFYGHSKVGEFTAQSEQLVSGIAAQGAVAIDNARLYDAAQKEIEHRRHTEFLLSEAKEAAEAANRAKSSFLANMSHEIRTPLTTIIGMADLLLSQEDDRQKASMLGTLQESGNHLVEIINDILDLSRIEAGQLRVENVPCDPRHIVQGVVALFRQRIEDKKLRLHFEVDEDVPESIRTDPVRLRQIVLNIVGNAVKFTEAGEISVKMQVSGDDPVRLDVIVADTGIGISDEHLDRLFQPFEQGDEAVARAYGGTGLGLVISRRLAEALGGGIEVESELGRGSTFRITIDAGPRRAASQAVARPSADDGANDADDPPGLPYRILVAEDTSAIQFLISRILDNAGASVVAVSNGEEVLERFEAESGFEHFDAILMDMQMPILDGYETVRELRSRGCQTPILALTANAMQGDAQKCLAAGCDDYLSKPIDQRIMLRTVASAVEKSR